MPAAFCVAPHAILAVLSAYPGAGISGFDFHLPSAHELARGDQAWMKLCNAREVKRQLPMKVLRLSQIVAHQPRRAQFGERGGNLRFGSIQFDGKRTRVAAALPSQHPAQPGRDAGSLRPLSKYLASARKP